MYNIIVPNLVHGWILCVELCGLSAEVIHNLPTPLSMPGLLLLSIARGIHILLISLLCVCFLCVCLSVCNGLNIKQGQPLCLATRQVLAFHNSHLQNYLFFYIQEDTLLKPLNNSLPDVSK